MALFPLGNCLSHEAKVKLLELCGNTGGDVKALEDKLKEAEENWGRRPEVHYTPKEPNPNAPMETIQEISQLIRIPSKWRKRPG